MTDEISVVIFGGGGFARETLELIRDINSEAKRYDVIGFIDDNQASWGTTLNDLPVLGGVPWLSRQANPPAMVLGVGAPALKQRLVTRLRPVVREFPILIHPNVVRSKYVACEEGVVITAGNILTCNIHLGAFALVNLACTIGHDAVVGRYATIAPGVHVSGNVHIDEGCDMGTGSAIIQGVTVGAWSIVGAGAVVTRHLPPNCTAVGAPARPIKHRDAGWQNASPTPASVAVQ